MSPLKLPRLSICIKKNSPNSLTCLLHPHCSEILTFKFMAPNIWQAQFWNGMLIIPIELTPFPSPEYFTDQPERQINQAVKIVQTKEESGMTATYSRN